MNCSEFIPQHVHSHRRSYVISFAGPESRNKTRHRNDVFCSCSLVHIVSYNLRSFCDCEHAVRSDAARSRAVLLLQMMQKLLLLACLVVAAHTAAPRKRQRAEVIDGRVELEYQARITAVRKVIRETVSSKPGGGRFFHLP